MSEFRFACPHCGQRISGDSGYKGQQIQCPACQQTFTVPNPAAKAAIGSPSQPEAKSAGNLSHLALVSLVCALGLGLGSIPAIICGHLARGHIRRKPSLRGKGLATAGLVAGYFLLLSSIAFLTVGFFVLGPTQGHQLTEKQQAANTPDVMAARRVDEVKIGDPASETAHQMKGRFNSRTTFMDKPLRHAPNGGVISYVLKVDARQPMSLYSTYWGNEAGGRRFDVIVDDVVIATQSLEFNDPGRFFDVEYAIPTRLTQGKTNVTVLFQAYPRNTVGGIFGLQMLKR